MSAGLFPLSRQQQFDSNSKVLSGARLYLYDGGTSTPRVGYKDLALSSAHPNPIVADAAGRLPLVYLATGYYRQRLTSKTGTLVFDDDGIPVLTTSAGGAGTSVDSTRLFGTRDVKIRIDDQPLSGYVRINGLTIGSATSGATERANADTQSLFEELWAFSNISLPAGKGASAAADFAANKLLTLPNMEGRIPIGRPDMGGPNTSGLAALLTGTSTAEPLATAGANTIVLTQVNMPSYTLTGGTVGSVTITGTTSIESATHTHPVIGSTSGQNQSHSHLYDKTNSAATVQSGSGATVSAFSTASTSTGDASQDHSHSMSFTSGTQSANHFHTLSGVGTGTVVSISSGGSGTAVNKLPPVMTFMIYVRL